MTITIPASLPDDAVGAAIAYAAAGLYLAPVRKGGKSPGSVLGERWQTKTSRDPAELAAMLAGTDHGIAAHCGRSGLVVLDVDHPELCDDRFRAEVLDNPAVPFQSTRDTDPRRGHYLLGMPADRSIGSPNAPWGEVRGRNGVIMLAPSHHPNADSDGGHYLWKRTGPVPVMPAWLADQWPDSKTTDDTVTDAEVAAWIAEHPSRQPGHRPGRIRVGPVAKYAGLVNGRRRQSRHVALTKALVWACKEVNAGWYGAGDLDQLRVMHREALTDDTHPNGAEPNRNDWPGVLAWAIAQAKNDPAIDGLTTPAATTVAELFRNATGPAASSRSPGTVPAGSPTTEPTVTTRREDTATVTEPAKVIPIRAVRVPDYAEDFWDRRPEFGIVRDWARQRMVSPWAVLGVTLARVAMTVPPTVKIPPMIATASSLNHYVGIVGPSSTGKSASSAVAAEAVDLSRATTLEPDGDLYLYPVGSGEGLVDQFGHTEHPVNPETGKPDKTKPQMYVPDRVAVLLEADEIDSLLAQTDRSAATITGQIKTAWTATKTLGFGYRGNGTRPPAHSYRLCIVVAIVPGMGAKILAMAPGGFPQRFTYMPAGDPLCKIPSTDVDPPRWVLDDQKWPNRPLLLTFPREAWAEVQQQRQTDAIAAAAWIRTPTKQENGHLLLAKAKVAALLAILGNRRTPTSEDWELAGIYMRISGDTFQAMCDYIDQDAEKGHIAKGIGQGITTDVADSVVAERKVTRAIAKLVDKIPADWLAGSDARRLLQHSERDTFPDAIAALLATGQIECQPTTGGRGSKGGVEYRKTARR